MHLQNNTLFYLGSVGRVLGLFVSIWGAGFVGVARICLGGKGLGKRSGAKGWKCTQGSQLTYIFVPSRNNP
jgi:hypothetical protein